MESLRRALDGHRRENAHFFRPGVPLVIPSIRIRSTHADFMYPDALARLHQVTRGTLRDFDRLVTPSLCLTAAKNRRLIDGAVVFHAPSIDSQGPAEYALPVQPLDPCPSPPCVYPCTPPTAISRPAARAVGELAGNSWHIACGSLNAKSWRSQ